MCSCCGKKNKGVQRYEIEKGIFSLFMPFSMLAIVLSSAYTFWNVYHLRHKELITETIKPTIFLNLEVIA